MKRSIRRHQQRVAKIRKIRNLGHHPHGCSWQAFQRTLLFSYFAYTVKPWKGYRYFLLNDPGWWTHNFHIRPMRIDSNRKCHAIVHGVDPDLIQWLDGKKPQIYYW